MERFSRLCRAQKWKRRNRDELLGVCERARRRAAFPCDAPPPDHLGGASASRPSAAQQEGLVHALAAALRELGSGGSQQRGVKRARHPSPSAPRKTLRKEEFIAYVETRAAEWAVEPTLLEAQQAAREVALQPLPRRVAASSSARLIVPHRGERYALPDAIVAQWGTQAPMVLDVIVPCGLKADRLHQWRSRGWPAMRLCGPRDVERIRAPCHVGATARMWTLRQLLQSKSVVALFDCVVAEELSSWPRAARVRLASLRTRCLVVGCAPSTEGLGLAEILSSKERPGPRLVFHRDWASVTPGPVATWKLREIEPETRPHETAQMAPLLDWTVRLVEALLQFCDVRRRTTFQGLGVRWRAYREGIQFVRTTLEGLPADGAQKASIQVLNQLDVWGTRAAITTVSSLFEYSEERLPLGAAALRAMLGPEVYAVCSRCLGLMLGTSAAHSCDWDGRAEVALPELEEAGALRVAMALEVRHPSSPALTRRCLVRACRADATRDGARDQPRFCGEVGTMLLREWKGACEAAGTQLDEGLRWPDAPQHLARKGCRLMLEGSRVSRAALRLIAANESTAAPLRSAPLREAGPQLEAAVQALPWDAMSDNTQLRVLGAHLQRVAGVVCESTTARAALELALPLLCDMLGHSWSVAGGPELLLRWGFHRQVCEVAVAPSFFLASEAQSRLQHAARLWEVPEVHCLAPRASPAALAMSLLVKGAH